MRTVIQRVSHASVTIDGCVHGSIQQGFLILLGIEPSDTEADADWLAKKAAGLRVFDDEEGIMNRDIVSIGGNALVVSQFTLMASYKKGNRPSYLRAAGHDIAVPLYEYFCQRLSEYIGNQVETGVFGADMKVELLNDGPVTICMDTKNKE
ncbi:D-aminoacyl-tRNA deacylase [Alloprevotella rava]|uniref:D-aminoacyl-tRNA deacylase n=1 Tax=Alloprevotella rava TaxID=671218 RepID=A0A7W5ULZ0_9BACT|nr:D-aminoacyl-tRNA deacylase [Alloprevotella rava]MBB3702152.1 D-tyrosyl-tRNA(Tyr) deacylase [Alloprevotella rava]